MNEPCKCVDPECPAMGHSHPKDVGCFSKQEDGDYCTTCAFHIRASEMFGHA